jgi:hypothetical protein
MNDMKNFKYSETVFSFGDSVHYTDKRENFEPSGLEKYLLENGHTDVVINKITAGIEDCFMSLMGSENE